MLKDLEGGTLQKITEAASLRALFVMGALVSKRRTNNVPIVVSKIIGPDGVEKVTTPQMILDQLMPGLLSLCLTLLVCKLLKKKMSPILLIFVDFVCPHNLINNRSAVRKYFLLSSRDHRCGNEK